MYHRTRWTPEKIKQRLELIAPLVYRNQKALSSFRYHALNGPLAPPPVGENADDSGWQEVNAHEYWGSWMQDFVLRTTFSIPDDWDRAQPIALYLPLGEAGDFSHPEALAYIDGEPYAACDRHHQEFLLKPEWADGGSHLLALHGWTGLGGFANSELFTRRYMKQCRVVQIHQPTWDFIIHARVALETANNIDEKDPARYHLYDALNDAFAALDTRDPLDCDEFYKSVEPATQIIKAGIEKAGAPMDAVIHATGHAHIDIAWLWTLGQTHRKAERTFHNSSWDWARFETCAHKWADLSEGDYGVSLLNDCKYGHDIRDNVMRITLLRSPTMPDPMADYGEHQVKYSLYPHSGSWNENTQREAYLLNDPIVVYQRKEDSGALRLSKGGKKAIRNFPSLISIDRPNMIIETIKRAEDGNGIIVRLYESQRKRGQVRVKLGFAVQSAWETNLLEENESELSVENDSIQLNLRPYQIMTIRLKEKA